MHVVYEIPKGVLGVELTVRCKQVLLLTVFSGRNTECGLDQSKWA